MSDDAKAVREHLARIGLDETLLRGLTFCSNLEESETKTEEAIDKLSQEAKAEPEVKTTPESPKEAEYRETSSEGISWPTVTVKVRFYPLDPIQVTDIAMIAHHPLWDMEQSWAMFSIDQLNELLSSGQSAPVIDISSFIVKSVRFRFPYGCVGSDPAIFTLLFANVDRKEGTADWKIHSYPPQTNHIMHPRSTVNVHLMESDNPEFLKTLWSRKYSSSNMNAPYMSPLSKLSKKHASEWFHSKSFEVFKTLPRKGSIIAGESQEITFKYSYLEVGRHEYSQLLRIYPNIFIWIDLQGRTLEKDTASLQFIHEEEMEFDPVSISNMDPPVQLFRMFNGGDVHASYHVEMEPFRKLKQENFGHYVIDCHHVYGEILPRSWSSVRLTFSPLEYKDYYVDLIINGPEGTQDRVKIVGSPSFSPDTCLRPKKLGKAIPKFIIFNPIVPISMTPSHITFQHFIPTGNKDSRLIFLKNLSHTNKISFTWNLGQLIGDGKISFSPHRGLLSPRETIPVEVTLEAGNVPVTFSESVRCIVHDETANAMFECLMKAWEKKQEMAKVATCDKNDVKPHEKSLKKPERPECFSLLLGVTAYIGTYFGQMENFLTREFTQIPYSPPVIQVIPKSSETVRKLLPPIVCELVREIITEILWDILHSSNFPTLIVKATRRQAPYFDEYKESEENSAMWDETDRLKLPVHSIENILQLSLLNIFHEMSKAAEYDLGDMEWYNLPKVQPQAMVDVERFKTCFR